ncbi:MAG: clostripain-related cysteine peptidase [Candidatus Heimdallarchaeota archaeon]
MKYTQVKALMIIFLFSLLIYSVDSIEKTRFPSKKSLQPQAIKNWTLMLYFCADTRSSYVTSDLNNSGNGLYIDMVGALNYIDDNLLMGSENDINIIALFDYPWRSDQPQGYANLYEISATSHQLVDQLGPINMGAQQTLEDFITYCKTNYPANYYSLSLVDHGRGYAGFCYDYHAPHPYWPYALGDCLTVEELDSALGNTGGVDLLCLNTCSGGSFEVAWQLIDEVDYIIAGEAIQYSNVLYHSVELAYNLSYNVNYTPLEFAQSAFDCAKDVQIAPWGYSGHWKTVSLYDLTKFDSIGASQNIMALFSDFTETLMDELSFNYSVARELFIQIRNESVYYPHVFSSQSMMIDLYDFIDRILSQTEDFHYGDILEGLATQLISKLDPATNDILLREYHDARFVRIFGFSICLPDTYDMYQEYLYPNFYENLAISVDTQWENFIFRLFPDVNFNMHQFEFWEFQLNRVDPSVSLHVYLEQDNLINPNPLHVGLNEFSDLGNGIELGIEGAEFYDDLLFGNSMIRIPEQSLSNLIAKSTEQNPITLKVVINATAAASATQQVNLTVKHVNNHSVVWKVNKISDFNIGETLICEVSTNEEITDFIIIKSPFNTGKTILGMPLEWFIISVTGSSLIIIFIIIFAITFTKRTKKRKKARRK